MIGDAKFIKVKLTRNKFFKIFLAVDCRCDYDCLFLVTYGDKQLMSLMSISKPFENHRIFKSFADEKVIFSKNFTS